ncbi:carboxypeptidase-like regulatory domain-containing protein [Hymenobacter agri]
MIRISGTVSDAVTKHGLLGVTVRIRATRQVALTNAQGNFILSAAPADTILFQLLGYKPHLLILPGTSLAQFVVHVRMQRDSIRLREVSITADRVDRASINRALRNIKRPTVSLIKGPQRIKLQPVFAVDSTPPPPPPTSGGPIGLIYDKFSRSGKQRRKMEQVKKSDKEQKARQRLLNYNKVFKDNRGYQ